MSDLWFLSFETMKMIACYDFSHEKVKDALQLGSAAHRNYG